MIFLLRIPLSVEGQFQLVNSVYLVFCRYSNIHNLHVSFTPVIAACYSHCVHFTNLVRIACYSHCVYLTPCNDCMLTPCNDLSLKLTFCMLQIFYISVLYCKCLQLLVSLASLGWQTHVILESF